VSRKSIGGDEARRRAIYFLIYYFSCGPSPPCSLSPPPRPDTRETFPEDSPWDRCPFSPRSCAPGGGNGSSVTQRREGILGREADRKTDTMASGNLRSYDVDNANWRSWLMIIPSFARRRSRLYRGGIERREDNDVHVRTPRNRHRIVSAGFPSGNVRVNES